MCHFDNPPKPSINYGWLTGDIDFDISAGCSSCIDNEYSLSVDFQVGQSFSSRCHHARVHNLQCVRRT